MQALRDQGRALPDAQLRTYETTIRAALPENSTQPGTNTKNDALAATLAQAEQAGHDPKALLQEAIAMRELDTAEDVNDVLVWRLRRLAQLPAHPGEAARSPQDDTGRATPPANRTGVRAASPASPRPAATDPRSRPPRR